VIDFGARPLCANRIVSNWSPRSRIARLIVGTGLIIGGSLWFLPVLGWWMLPVGIAILSTDYPRIRRMRRKAILLLYRIAQAKRSTK